MSPPIKLYAHRTHYTRAQRAQLAEILRPFWKDATFTELERQALYGLSATDFQIVDDLAQADLAVLPMTWNHYLATRQLARARQFTAAARQAQVPVLSYVSGDAGVTVPAGFDDVYIVRASGLRSRRHPRQIAQPIFFADPLKKYPEFSGPASQLEVSPPSSDTRQPQPPAPDSQLPSVGFCGQASRNGIKFGWDLLRGCWRQGLYYLRLRHQEPQPLLPPAWLRAQALRLLASSPQVQTRFVVRKRYRGGSIDAAARARTSREFYQNLAATDYTLCVRGGGNFSQRFYETLALGRIPVLVDTDCLLPFDSVLNWGELIVRVPQAELASLPQVVARHFAQHGPDGLAEIKRRCRQRWEEWLTFAGFHRQLAQWILQAGSSKFVLDGTSPRVEQSSQIQA